MMYYPVLTNHGQHRLAQRGISLHSLQYVRLNGSWRRQHYRYNYRQRQGRQSESYVVTLHRNDILEDDLPRWRKCAGVVAVFGAFNQLITAYRTRVRTRRPYVRSSVNWRSYLADAA